jgi:hypothetical protein
MGMMARQAQLDELVKKMNTAQGVAKTDAMAELLNALVENHRTMCGAMMADMMSKMSMTGAQQGHRAGGNRSPEVNLLGPGRPSRVTTQSKTTELCTFVNSASLV